MTNLMQDVQRAEAQLDVNSIIAYFDAYGFDKHTFHFNLLFQPVGDPRYVN
jgi:hypothetical protein